MKEGATDHMNTQVFSPEELDLLFDAAVVGLAGFDQGAERNALADAVWEKIEVIRQYRLQKEARA